MDYGTRPITVWECRSVDGRQVIRKIEPSHPDDHRYQHEYQRIVYRGPADQYGKVPLAS